MSENSVPKVIGIDGGGTKCKASLFDGRGNILAEAIAGPANVFQNYQLAINSIMQASTSVLDCYNTQSSYHVTVDQLHIGLGLAGLGIESAKIKLNLWEHPFKSATMVTDLHASAIGAFGGSNGLLVIAGTGSCVAALMQGQITQYGGHGFLLGDKASGAWLGLKAIQYWLEAYDGVKEQGKLFILLTEQLHNLSSNPVTPSGVITYFANASPAKFAEFAPILFSAHTCQYANSIINEGASYLSSLINSATNKLARDELPSICLQGGVVPRYVTFLDESIANRIVESKQTAEWGAANLALKEGFVTSIK